MVYQPANQPMMNKNEKEIILRWQWTAWKEKNNNK